MKTAAVPTNTLDRLRAITPGVTMGLVLCTVLFVAPLKADSGLPRDDSEREYKLVRQAQEGLIQTIDRVAPAVVCVFDEQEQGGGSGVIIDAQGHGLTNFHVVAGMLPTRRGLGGLSDGTLYELEVLGIDPTGDLAMFRLRGRDEFPFAQLGDSDRVRVGDTALALGNPFTLSEDYAPTVTTGLVSGVHRYQWGVGNNLIYSDCIQTDASINPGNSGGPLFNDRGEVIGINGRISVNTRGRYNVGHGYAISSNQIRRFIPALRAGLLAKHGTLQATVVRSGDDDVVFDNVRAGFAADRAGLRIGDRLRFLDGMPIDTPNRFASVIGTYPENWGLMLTIERNGEPLTRHARLDAFEPKLPQPFEPDDATVDRAVSRVLDAYRKAMRGSSETEEFPRQIRWTWSRSEQRASDASERRESQFVVAWSQDQPMVMRQSGAHGAVTRIIEVDAMTATQRHGAEGAKFDLAPDESMVLRGLFVGLIQWLGGGAFDREALTHAGGDALPFEWSLTQRQSGPGVMEVLHAPLGEGFEANFGFDDATGLLASIHIRDSVSGATATVTLSDYRDVGAIQWPTSLRMELPGRLYADRLTDISVTP